LLTCNIVPPNCTAAAFSVDDTDILLNDAFFVKHLSSHSCCSIPATTGTGRGYKFNVLIRFQFDSAVSPFSPPPSSLAVSPFSSSAAVSPFSSSQVASPPSSPHAANISTKLSDKRNKNFFIPIFPLN